MQQLFVGIADQYEEGVHKSNYDDVWLIDSNEHLIDKLQSATLINEKE